MEKDGKKDGKNMEKRWKKIDAIIFFLTIAE